MRFAPVLLAVGAGLALPGAGLAFGAAEHAATPVGEFGNLPFTPARVDPALARKVEAIMGVAGLRFTPAAKPAGKKDRTVTFAVRVDAATARALALRPDSESAAGTDATRTAALALAPSRYNLGIARGYQSFSQPTKTAALVPGVRAIKAPDLAELRPLTEGAADKPSRFQTRLALEQRDNAGRSPQTLDGLGEQRVDLGGSYRLGRNLNVTAGVRLSQDRDRLAPLTDGVEDAQAVYVGTQIRF